MVDRPLFRADPRGVIRSVDALPGNDPAMCEEMRVALNPVRPPRGYLKEADVYSDAFSGLTFSDRRR